jgi:membrane protease YdiL (CAAX protease family)
MAVSEGIRNGSTRLADSVSETFWRLSERLLGPVPDVERPRGLDADRRATVVLWSAAVILILVLFNAGFDTAGDIYPGWAANRDGLAHHIYWVSWGWLLELAVPLAIILFVFRESPARYGLRWSVSGRTLLTYGSLMLVMAPLLFWASTRDSFLDTYPFVRDLGGNWPVTIAIWEVAYISRFVCLEFFFRGYLLFGLEEKLGYTAIAATTVPYAMIHFSKPFPEAMGAIVAGAVLGYLALRTRTIVGGLIIHCTVAVSMDMLALWRMGYF